LTSEGEKTGKPESARRVEIKDVVDSDDIEILHDDVYDAEEGGSEEAEPAGKEVPEWLKKRDVEQEGNPEKMPEGMAAGKKRPRKTTKADMLEHLSRKNEMLQKLRERLVETEKVVEIKEDRLMRLAAEFENYKKRTSREWDLLKNQANAGLLTEVLGVIDDFDRAFEHSGDSIEHFRDGIVLIRSSLLYLLKRYGLREIESAGKPFDPQFHEAVAEMNSENIEPGFVAEVILKGYLMNDQVIRPAKVVVSKGRGE
jgi:molecular chaperone GrpE